MLFVFSWNVVGPQTVKQLMRARSYKRQFLCANGSPFHEFQNINIPFSINRARLSGKFAWRTYKHKGLSLNFRFDIQLNV